MKHVKQLSKYLHDSVGFPVHQVDCNAPHPKKISKTCFLPMFKWGEKPKESFNVGLNNHY